MTKTERRAEARKRKKIMTTDDIDHRSRMLCEQVLQTPQYQQANTVYGYLPFNQEVDLTTLLSQALHDGKQVALPKCYGKEMRFILVTDLSRIQYTNFGMPEPVDDAPVASDFHALVIVPGLLFDHEGYRIGYGGGYYDRFLSQEPDHPTIGLCYDFQMTDQLPRHSHDLPVDVVFSMPSASI